MAYPSTITAFVNPLPTDKLNNPSHSAVETLQNTTLTQIMNTVGTDASTIGTVIGDLRNPLSNGGGHVQTAPKGGTGMTSYTKGDLLVASNTSTLSRLAVGSDGQVPIADSTQTSGVKWGGVATATNIQNQTYNYARASVLSSSVYGVDLGNTPSILSDGLAVVAKFPTQNTTSVLALSVNTTSQGSIAARIKNVDGTNPIVGAIKASMIGILEFDSVSSVFQLQNTYVPTYGTDTSQFLRNDGQFASVLINSTSGGGGGPASTLTQTITHGLGRVPKIIRLDGIGPFAGGAAAATPSHSHGVYNDSGNTCVYITQVPGGSGVSTNPSVSTSFAVYLAIGNGDAATGVVQNVNSSSFGIAWTGATVSASAGQFIWETQ